MAALEMPTASYSWCIPSISNYKQRTLCTAYIRNTFKTKSIVPKDVINLCTEYFYPNDTYSIYEIKSGVNGSSFASKIFWFYKLRWYLKIYPNGDNKESEGDFGLYLFLAHFPSTLKSISTRVRLVFEQGDVKYVCNKDFLKKKNNRGWKTHTLATKDIQKYDELTFNVTVDLLAVMDKDGHEVTNNYVQFDENHQMSGNKEKQKNAEKIDILAAKIEDLFIKVDKMQQQINDLEMQRCSNINDELRVKNADTNTEKQQFKVWLESTVKLPEWLETFVENGFDELETVTLLTIDVLESIGINKIGHRLKLMKHINNLKKNDNGSATM